MKKHIIFFLVCALMAFMLTACNIGGGDDQNDPGNAECTHEGGTATCTSLAVCTLCGAEYGETAADAHSFSAEWSSADGKHFHACEYGCGAVSDEADCLTDATCTDKGKCSVCGADGTKTNPDNHKASDEWSSADGMHFHACENGCGTRLDLAVCDIDVDCTNVGECSVCGAVGTSADPNNHNVSTEWSYADGKHFHACYNGCGMRFDEGKCDAVSTCTDKGRCSVCGTEGEALNPTNHSLASKWTYENGTHYIACLNGCGAKLSRAECDTTPTCTDKGKCSVCGTEGEAPDPSNHKMSAAWQNADGKHFHACEYGCGLKTDEGVCDPISDCVDPGACSVCGAPGTIDPEKHSYSEDYSMTAETHFKACENGCSLRLEEEEHSFGVWSTVTKSTTTQRGTVERTCHVCGYKETKESDALIMSVKDGANGIAVLIHDDGTWNTAVIADEMYRQYGIVGDVAMQLNGGRVINSGDRYDLTDDTIATTSIQKWRTLFATNRWKLISHSMTHTWWGTYTTTTDDAGNIISCTDLVEDMDLMEYEIIKSQMLLRYYFPGQKVLTFAHPGFANPKNYLPGVTTGLGKYQVVFGENARELIDKYYIAGRGGLGINVDVNNSQGQWESSSSTSSYAALPYSDVWNYFPAYSLDDGNLTKSIGYVDSAAQNGGLAVFYIHKLSKNESDMNASNTMYSGNYEKIVKAIADYADSGKIWNTFYEDAILYLQEAQTAEVSMRTDESGNIYLTLTDGVSRFMLDENGNETDEQIYTYPLTVRVNVPTEWMAVKIEQNGTVSYVATKTVGGKRVADVNIVPDAGEAKVSQASRSDIPPEEDPAPVVGTGTIEYDVSYDFENGISDVTASISSSEISTTAAVEDENGNNWLEITKLKGVRTGGGSTWTLPGGYLPTSAATMSVSFKIKVNKALLEEGGWGNITGNKRLFNITFGDNSPYTLIVWRDITSSTDGDTGKLYLADCASSFAANTFNNLLELEFDTEYEIRIDMRMDGVNPFLAETYVSGNKVAESSQHSSYTVGSVPTVEYVRITAQGRAVFNVWLDDVTIKSTAPKGEVEVSVYKQSFDGKDVSMSLGGNNNVKATYGSPEDDGRIALNINKAKTDNATNSYTMIGNSVSKATSFSFKFDVYIDGASTAGSSARLYQIHFATVNTGPYVLTIELSGDGTGYVLKDMANSNNDTNATVISDTISFNEWHTIELVVTLDGEFGAMAYVDGKTNGTVSKNYGRGADGDPVVTSLDKVALFAQKASGANIYFDNFDLTAKVKFS